MIDLLQTLLMICTTPAIFALAYCNIAKSRKERP
jgi:hypothetical protein